MRPLRSGGANPFSFTAKSAVMGLLAAMVGGSVLWGFFQRTWGEMLLLSPDSFFREKLLFEVLSYVFIATRPTNVLFGGLVIWVVGADLERSWGVARLYAFAILVPVLSGLLASTFIWFVYPEGDTIQWAGATTMTTALWVADGWRVGSRQTNFWGIPLTGNVFALIGIGFVIVGAALTHPLVVVPEAFSVGLTYLYMRGWSPRPIWLRFQAWRVQSQMRERAKKLRIVEDGRNTSRDSDKFLH